MQMQPEFLQTTKYKEHTLLTVKCSKNTDQIIHCAFHNIDACNTWVKLKLFSSSFIQINMVFLNVPAEVLDIQSEDVPSSSSPGRYGSTCLSTPSMFLTFL